MGSMDGLGHDMVAIGGGVAAGTGLVLVLVGAPLWTNRSQPPPLEVSIGAGTVDLRGTF